MQVCALDKLKADEVVKNYALLTSPSVPKANRPDIDLESSDIVSFSALPLCTPPLALAMQMDLLQQMSAGLLMSSDSRCLSGSPIATLWSTRRSKE